MAWDCRKRRNEVTHQFQVLRAPNQLRLHRRLSSKEKRCLKTEMKRDDQETEAVIDMGSDISMVTESWYLPFLGQDPPDCAASEPQP